MGTASGAARARALRVLKAAGVSLQDRQAAEVVVQQPRKQPQQPSASEDQSLILADGGSDPLMGSDALDLVPVAQGVADLLPTAVGITARALRGEVRGLAARDRVMVALRVIELSGKGFGGGASGASAVAVSAIGKALALRQRTLDAVPVRVESVVPATSAHSEKQSDS